MDAIVLVGGQGTRLRPLTYDTPKPMLPVVDRPLVRHVVAWLGCHGIDRVVLSLGYRPDSFIDAFPDNEIDGVALAYAVEDEPLDSAGAVRFAAEVAGVSERFLVLNGDVLTDFDATSLMEFHTDHGAAGSIYLTPVEDPSHFGVVETEGGGRVKAFIEKPPPGTATTNLINAGTYVLETSVLDLIPSGRPVSIERETFPLLAGNGDLYALGSDAYWIDTGTPGKYIDAQLDILHGRRTPRSLPDALEVAPGVFASGKSAAAKGCPEISGVAFLGEGSEIAEGALVVDSVVGPSARIDRDARVERSIVMHGAVVGEGCVVTDSIVGPGAVVGPRARLSDLTVVRGSSEVLPETSLNGARFPSS